MATRLGTAVVELRTDNAPLERGLADAKRSGTHAAGAIEQAFSTALGFAGAELALRGLDSAFAAVEGAVFGMNSSLETSTLQFKVLMGDADAAREHVAGLFAFAATTPFEAGPIIEASRLMETFGGATLNSKANLTLFGDAAAATSRQIDEVAFWFGRMYAAMQAGKPFGEATMRLSEMAIITPDLVNKLDAMSDAGASASAMWETVTGSLGRFSGGMEAMAGTWAGVTSTFKDAVQLLTAHVFSPFFELVKDGLAGVNKALGSKQWETAAEIFRAAISGALGIVSADVKSFAQDRLMEAGRWVAKHADDIGRFFFVGMAVVKAALGEGVKSTQAFVTGLGRVAEGVGVILGALGTAFEELANNIGGALRHISKALHGGEIIMRGMELLGAAPKGAAEQFRLLAGGAHQAADAMEQYKAANTGATKGMSLVAAGMNDLNDAFAISANLQAAYQDAMAAYPGLHLELANSAEGLAERTSRASEQAADGTKKAAGSAKKALKEAIGSLSAFDTAWADAVRNFDWELDFGEGGSRAAAALIAAIVDDTEAAGARVADSIDAVRQEAQEAGVPGWQALGEMLHATFRGAMEAGTPESIEAALSWLRELDRAITEAKADKKIAELAERMQDTLDAAHERLIDSTTAAWERFNQTMVELAANSELKAARDGETKALEDSSRARLAGFRKYIDGLRLVRREEIDLADLARRRAQEDVDLARRHAEELAAARSSRPKGRSLADVRAEEARAAGMSQADIDKMLVGMKTTAGGGSDIDDLKKKQAKELAALEERRRREDEERERQREQAKADATFEEGLTAQLATFEKGLDQERAELRARYEQEDFARRVANLEAERDEAITKAQQTFDRIVTIETEKFDEAVSKIKPFMDAAESIADDVFEEARQDAKETALWWENIVRLMAEAGEIVNPTIPPHPDEVASLHSGGITKAAGLAYLHPREAIMPLDHVQDYIEPLDPIDAHAEPLDYDRLADAVGDRVADALARNPIVAVADGRAVFRLVLDRLDRDVRDQAALANR